MKHLTVGEYNFFDRLIFNPIPNSSSGRNIDNCLYASRGFHTRVINIVITSSNFGVCAQVQIHATPFQISPTQP